SLLKRLLYHIDEVMNLPDAGIWEIRDDNRVHTFSLLFHWVGSSVAARIGEALGDEELRTTARAIAEKAESLIEQTWNEEGGFYADSMSSDYQDAAMLMMIN